MKLADIHLRLDEDRFWAKIIRDPHGYWIWKKSHRSPNGLYASDHPQIKNYKYLQESAHGVSSMNDSGKDPRIIGVVPIS